MPKTDYSSWPKEDLIIRINALEKRKKYGLVWDTEREPEKIVLDYQNELPVLKEIKDNEIHSGDDDITHILIEGDNYHALSVLNYSHEKAIVKYKNGKLGLFDTKLKITAETAK